MIGKTMTLAIVVSALACGSARASGCSPGSHDRAGPAAVMAAVTDRDTKFDWATGVDTDGTKHRWISHSVANRGKEGLSLIWEKAGIAYAPMNPLAPGEAGCHRFLARRARLDRDAPLRYGEERRERPAVVYW